MFLNFLLHEEMKQMLLGVDVMHVRSNYPSDEAWEKQRRRNWERWCRNWMGLRDSPYRSIQHLIRVKYIAYGDRFKNSNPFHWKEVVYNLPGGTEGYDSSLPWIMKVRPDGNLASELYAYVDDGRATGHSLQACWAAVRRFASVCKRMGIHDAARKRTFPSLTPGPWAGTVTHTDRGER